MTTPITLTPDQVRAALDGRLAEIRTPLTKLRRFGKITEFGKSTTKGYAWHFRNKEMRFNDLRHGELLKYLPYAAGDLIWCQEQYCFDAQWDLCPTCECEEMIRAVYDCNTLKYLTDETIMNKTGSGEFISGHGRPASTMPKWASRLTLKVQSVHRVESLHDITEKSAIKQGCPPKHDVDRFLLREKNFDYSDYVAWWTAAQWAKQERPKGQWWTDNPWVSVYGVEVINQNVEELERKQND